MKVLITGANGLLGQYLTRLLLSHSFEVVATGKGENRHAGTGFVYREMDILDEPRVHAVMHAEKPEVVVHAAAMTQVDDCEKDPERCEAINVRGTTHVLVNAEAFARHFIYVSTDFVFDGEKGMYREEDDLLPVNFYGFTKMQAEAIMQTSAIPFSIVRTCLVYGEPLHGNRSNIYTWVRNSLAESKNIKVVNDQWRTPTFVEDLALGIALIIGQNRPDTWHISGEELMTPYDLARKIADAHGYDSGLIEPVHAGIFSQPGRRPAKTGFDISKAKRELGFQPRSLAEGIKILSNR